MRLCHRLLLLAAGLASWAAAQEPLVIGNQRQLFVDNYLVGSLLAGKPVRLCVTLSDADLYSLVFNP